MGKYAIYKYKLTKKEKIQGDWTQGENVSVPIMEHAYENFEQVFGGKGVEVRMQKEKKGGGGGDSYPCHVMAHEDNIILLRIENIKSGSYFDLKHTSGPIPTVETKHYDSYPPIFIVIDNRPNKAQIAIEIDTAAWRKTDVVRDILQESLNRALEKFGLSIEIRSKMQKSDYWGYVTHRQKKEGRSIKRMTFSFPNAKIRPSIETAIGLSNHLKSLMELINSIGGAQGELSIQAPANDSLQKKKLTDITKMVALCASSDYSLCVTFDDDITYRCNEYIRAELPLTFPDALSNFENGQKTLLFNYEIEQWLDWVVEQTENYQDAEQIKPKPNRKRTKAV